MIESIINNNLCISCGLCGAVCPVKCISFHAERGLNLPLINHKINSSAVEHLANFGEDMRKFRTLEDERGRELLESCKESESPNLILNRKILQALKNDERILIIREAGRILELKTLITK